MTRCLHLQYDPSLCLPYRIKKRTIVGVDSLTFVKVKIFSEAHVVVVSVDVLAPAIEKLMQTGKKKSEIVKAGKDGTH